jgi:hypothetical protein
MRRVLYVLNAITSVIPVNSFQRKASNWVMSGQNFKQSLQKATFSQLNRLAKISGVGAAIFSLQTKRSFATESEPKSSDEFISTASGLKYFDVKVGEGSVPLPGDTVL